VLLFLGLAAVLIIIFSVLWHFVEQDYNSFLAGVAKAVVSRSATVTIISGKIYFGYIVSSNGGFIPKAGWIDPSSIQFGLILAVALVAATPGLSLVRRVAFSLIAIALTLSLQLIGVAVMARTFSSLLFVIVSDVFPPVFWAAFTLKYWLNIFNASPARTEARVRT